jgi:hypothetical protein
VIPRVTGLTEGEAVRELERLGLVAAVERVPVDDRAQDGIVVAQIPIGDGTKMVDAGATVTIQVGDFTGDDDGGGDDGGGDDGGGDDGGGDDDGGDDGGGDDDGGGEPVVTPGPRR